jgi:hypothetical protein
MSFMDKVKSLFSGGSSAGADEHAGHDHSAPPQAPAEPMPPADPAGMPMSEPGSDADEDRPA